MNKFNKSYIVFSTFVATYFAEMAINIACGPEPDPYDYYVSFFHNNTVGDGYTPFSFTNLRFLYDETEPQRESAINCEEWAAYLGRRVKPADVAAVMYHTDTATDTAIAAYISRDLLELPDSLAANTYLQALLKKEGARSYYLFAKSVEPHAVISYSYWDPEPVDTSSMMALAEQALAAAKANQRDEFLQQRYAYQAARMYHYSGAYEQCVAVYEEWLAGVRKHTAVKGWALSLKAGAQRRLGEPAEAAYLFSRVFQSNPERRVQAYKNFHYIDVPFDEVLAFAQSDDERAAIWAIRGFNNSDFDRETLTSVYRLAPGNMLVGVLLTREINKLESQLAEKSQYYGGGWWGNYYVSDSTLAKAREHAVWIAGFARLLATEGHYREPELGVVSEAYVQWLLGDDDGAAALLASLRMERLSEPLADQYRIVELLTKVHQLTTTNKLDEEELLPALQWLDRKRHAEAVSVRERYGHDYYYWRGGGELRFNRTATNLYQSVLAPHYMRQKDTAMAALLMWHGEPSLERTDGQPDEALFGRLGWSTRAFWQEQLQPAALEQLAAWGRDGLNRPWAPLFQGQLGAFESDEFWDLLGTAYLRMHDYGAALKVFEHVSPEFVLPTPVNWYGDENPLWPDPFVETLNDYPKRFGSATLSKAEFAKTMADLQQKIITDPRHAAEYYFQLANGVYQTGAFGNSWQLISYSWTSTDNYLSGTYYYSGDFHEARQAATWYQQARELSDDNEFKARCTFMLAKCEQKTYRYDTMRDYYESAYGLGGGPAPFWLFSQRNKYFGELAQRYGDTDFFKRAVSECSYLSDFIN